MGEIPEEAIEAAARVIHAHECDEMWNGRACVDDDHWENWKGEAYIAVESAIPHLSAALAEERDTKLRAVADAAVEWRAATAAEYRVKRLWESRRYGGAALAFSEATVATEKAEMALDDALATLAESEAGEGT